MEDENEEPDDSQSDPALSFFSALRALRHLYFRLEKHGVELHSDCYDCREVEAFINVARYRGPATVGDWEGAFVVTIDGLKHLYFLLEQSKLDLHSGCDGCYEIRNFMMPGYRGNQEDTIGVSYFRPLSEYDFDYQQAVAAEKPLFANFASRLG